MALSEADFILQWFIRSNPQPGSSHVNRPAAAKQIAANRTAIIPWAVRTGLYSFGTLLRAAVKSISGGRKTRFRARGVLKNVGILYNKPNNIFASRVPAWTAAE